jgi:hypothetical protein
MEDHMTDLMHAAAVTPRRGFFTRMAGAMALGFAGFAATPLRAQTAAAGPNGPNWPGALKGRHRQVVDAYEINSGFPLAFVYTFMAPNDPSDATAVLVLRHGAFPIALGDEMWKKYKIGEAFKILDPETKAPAVKNPFFKPKPGVLPLADMAIDRLLANATVVGALQHGPDDPEQDARRQCRGECGRGRQGMGRQRDSGHHRHSVGNLGREPGAASRLQLLRRRLIAAAAGHHRRHRRACPGEGTAFPRARAAVPRSSRWPGQARP